MAKKLPRKKFGKISQRIPVRQDFTQPELPEEQGEYGENPFATNFDSSFPQEFAENPDQAYDQEMQRASNLERNKANDRRDRTKQSEGEKNPRQKNPIGEKIPENPSTNPQEKAQSQPQEGGKEEGLKPSADGKDKPKTEQDKSKKFREDTERSKLQRARDFTKGGAKGMANRGAEAAGKAGLNYATGGAWSAGTKVASKVPIVGKKIKKAAKSGERTIGLIIMAILLAIVIIAILIVLYLITWCDQVRSNEWWIAHPIDRGTCAAIWWKTGL